MSEKNELRKSHAQADMIGGLRIPALKDFSFELAPPPFYKSHMFQYHP